MKPPETLSSRLSINIATQIPTMTLQEAVAICLFTDEPHLSTPPPGENAVWHPICEQMIADGEFKGEAETSLLIHASLADAAGRSKSVKDASSDGANRAQRILLVGLGEHSDFDAAVLRRAAGMAVRKARAAHVSHLYFVMPEEGGVAPVESLGALAEGAHLGLYNGDLYKKKDEDEEGAATLEELTFIVSQESEELRQAVERARVIAESVNWTRTLADEPGLSLPPREFARRAAEMAAEFGLKVESLNAEEIEARGMGGLLGVGQGSDEPPALIVIRYEPETAPADDEELLAFVGKGITFDTGGISLKKPAGMEEMKSDMAGGAAALGALRAIAQLKPGRRIVAIIPCAENMPSGRAIKPGDIVRTLAGYTVEVADTDAEGRLVLIDGIAYAKQLGATRIIDLATLTGSIIIALGSHRTGLFSNDDAWAGEVTRAAESAGEPVWRMPVSDDYKKRIESMIADFKNYGGRPDAIAAALLLSKFADATPWVHLDIAGTAWYDAPKPYAPKGTSGTGVRTLVELACRGED